MPALRRLELIQVNECNDLIVAVWREAGFLGILPIQLQGNSPDHFYFLSLIVRILSISSCGDKLFAFVQALKNEDGISI